MSKNLKNIAEKSESNFLDFLNKIEERITDESQADRDKTAFKIAYHLKKQNLKQKDLAEKIGVKTQQINRIIKGKQDFKHSTLFKIQKALGIQLIDSDLINENKSETIIVMKNYSTSVPLNSNEYVKKEINRNQAIMC